VETALFIEFGLDHGVKHLPNQVLHSPCCQACTRTIHIVHRLCARSAPNAKKFQRFEKKRKMSSLSNVTYRTGSRGIQLKANDVMFVVQQDTLLHFLETFN
jgi:hypothetical protein